MTYKWAKMAEKYGNTTINSEKDIFEIKLNPH